MSNLTGRSANELQPQPHNTTAVEPYFARINKPYNNQYTNGAGAETGAAHRVMQQATTEFRSNPMGERVFAGLIGKGSGLR